MYKKLLWTILILVAFGLVMLSSAGVVDGQKKMGDPYYFVKHQFLFGVLPGLVLMLGISKIDYKIWRKLSLPILFVALVLLILIFIPGFGLTLKGARSWITIAGYTFQPVEPLKLSLVIYLAAWFGGKDDRLKNWVYGTAPFFTVLAFVALLLILQPDIGSLGIVAVIAMGVFFMAGGSMKHIGLIALICFIVLGTFVAIEPYRLNRVKSMLNPSLNPRGASYQLNQSMIAIGSGGLFGVGFGKSTQKFGFLPETIGDSIFAVIAEELGFIGSMITIGLFLYLTFIMTKIARLTKDKFASLLVMGMAIWITFQALVNIAAISGVGPLTGIPLPFISYGGTALVSLLIGLGIVLNISRTIKA